jgi:hypothetical protein
VDDALPLLDGEARLGVPGHEGHLDRDRVAPPFLERDADEVAAAGERDELLPRARSSRRSSTCAQLT